MKLVLKTIVLLSILFTIKMLISCNKTPLANVDSDNKATNANVKIAKNQIVFIAGFDEGDNQYYNNARAYFKGKSYTIIEDQYSLEAIINWLNTNANEALFSEIHIVSHSNPWRGMSLKTIKNGERITVENLQKNITDNHIPKLKNVISNNTNIIFHSCGLGENKLLLKTLKTAFSSTETPNLIASPYFNVFGGEFADHYLAKPYYVFYPTSKSPGKIDLSKEIAKKYPKEKKIKWLTALKNKNEKSIGEAYNYQFNIPVKWEFDFKNSTDQIPTFKTADEIMDWLVENEEITTELLKLNIPIEKFRWNSKIKNNKLIILGKTTVICVLKPLTTNYANTKHLAANTKNTQLYNKI